MKIKDAIMPWLYNTYFLSQKAETEKTTATASESKEVIVKH